MAVLVSRTSSPRLPSFTAVLRMVAGVSSHRRRCVVYIFISELRATVWVFFLFHADVQCHRAEIGSRLEGGGAAPWGMTQG